MTRRELRPEINPASNKTEIAIYIDGTNMGYAQSYLKADEIATEITTKREVVRPATGEQLQSLLDQLNAPVAAAYVAPRRQPRKAKVSAKKTTCSCPHPDCGNDAAGNGVHFCTVDRAFIAWHDGRRIGQARTEPQAQQLLNNHRYALLTHPLPSDLDPEQAADVLAARGVNAA